jgi:hypothetical protein
VTALKRDMTYLKSSRSWISFSVAIIFTIAWLSGVINVSRIMRH